MPDSLLTADRATSSARALSGPRKTSWDERLAAATRWRVAPLHRQFTTAIAATIGLILVCSLTLTALLHIQGAAPLVLLGTVALFGVLVIARLLLASVVSDVEALRCGLAAVGQGRRDLQIETTGAVELAQLAGTANAMITRLAEAEGVRGATDATLRHLIAAVSHDLRTPITSLSLLTDALDDEVIRPEERADCTARMRTHINALSVLVDDLFELARLQAGDIAWSIERVCLADIVTDTVGAMRAQAEARGIVLYTELSRSPDVVHANPAKVQRVLFNLIANAIRHTPPEGSVTIRSERVSESIEVEVADSGDGIAPDERDHVFDAFIQGSGRPARGNDGSGLGLAISRAIIEAHGGRIWLEEAGARRPGTRVRFSLPAAG